jgi:hypothetical protein
MHDVEGPPVLATFGRYKGEVAPIVDTLRIPRDCPGFDTKPQKYYMSTLVNPN